MFSPKPAYSVHGFANSRKDSINGKRNLADKRVNRYRASHYPRTMSPPAESLHAPGQPGVRFDPYVRLMRSLLPRASSIALFGPAGELQWSTETMTGPDLLNAVEDALLVARSDSGSVGQVRTLAGNLPVYLYALRDDAKQLLALLAIVCRAQESQDKRNQDFSFAS